MPSAFSWPMSVPSALRAPAPVNQGVRLSSNTSQTNQRNTAKLMLELLAQVLFELPAAGIAWLIKRYTGINQRTAELIAIFVFFALVCAACLTAWYLYQHA